jgi:hypothetical protein
MKVWLAIAGFFAFCPLPAGAQGTVNFANAGAGVNAPVKLAGVVQPPDGAEWQAELLLLGSDGSSKKIGDPILLQTGNLAGFFFGGPVLVPGSEPGGIATFRVRAFDTAGMAEAISNPVTITLGGGKTPPANLVGLANWTIPNLIPELAITVSQISVILSWSKDFPDALLEFTDRLTNSKWSAVTATPQTVGSRVTVTVPLAISERYYRLKVK